MRSEEVSGEDRNRGREVYRSKEFGRCNFSGCFYSGYPVYLSLEATEEYGRVASFRKARVFLGIRPPAGRKPASGFHMEYGQGGPLFIIHPETFEDCKDWLEPVSEVQPKRHFKGY